MQCPLCGYEFDPTKQTCHSTCPLSERCALICCPNCGYQIPDETKTSVAAWLRRRLARLSSAADPRDN